MERYDALNNSFGAHKIKYTLRCGTCRGFFTTFTTPLLGNCKGAEVMSTDIFEILEESNLDCMEFDHLRLRFDDEGLIIEFLNDEGEVAVAVDQYWFDEGLKMTDSLYELRKFVLRDLMKTGYE